MSYSVQIGRIGEFYGATEGNANIINNMNVSGCVGYSPISFQDIPFLQQAFPVALLQLDTVTGELLRNADRRCVKCKVGEPGELVGRITRKMGSYSIFSSVYISSSYKIGNQ